MIIGVDIGGTFTDLVVHDAGQISIHKVLSTPHNPAEAMLKGLRDVTQGDLARIQQVVHGSTVATNAILERKGARIVLIVTQGFGDILHIARQQRPQLYALHPSIPEPLVSKDNTFEIEERLDHHGNVLVKLTKKAIDAVIKRIKALDVDAVAVALLYSYRNPEHEQAIRERIIEKTKLEAWQVALSSDVLPEFREYERTTTTVLEAYVRPVMARYIQHLQENLPETMPLRIMKSDGGVMNASHITQRAAHTALSGPAAGVIGARYLANLAGYEHIITFDMGGTSTDVALMTENDALSHTTEIDGLPLRLRLLDIETIGAGGGSLVSLDAGGALRVGPESAGADPGPIIYGQGGEKLTVSDANALLGRIQPDAFFAGQMPLALEDTQRIAEQVAHNAHLTPEDLAHGIIDIANANIERALRRVSVARGHDPREFTLVAFGGAGPLHACEVAQRLDIQRVLIPRHPGVLCALGLLVADISLEQVMPVMERVEQMTIPRLRAKQGRILAWGREELARQGIDPKMMQYEISLDIRYVGQAYELSIPFFKTVLDDFHQAHQIAYGHAMPDHPLEIVAMRLRGYVTVDKPEFQPQAPATTSPQFEIVDTPSGRMSRYQRDDLTVGTRLSGKALIIQPDSIVYIPADWQAQVDAYHNLILTHTSQGNDAL
jgi:N-methylhydantoinase A